MNKPERIIYDQYKIKPALYPLVKAIHTFPESSNEFLAEKCHVTPQHIGNLTKQMEKMKLIADVSNHRLRRRWIIRQQELVTLIREAEIERKGRKNV